MPESKHSCDCKVFETAEEARAHGIGGIWYDGGPFPAVDAVWIMMPILDPDGEIVAEPARWSVSKPNHCKAQWTISGTWERPTLSPSLHWVDVWHGFLRDGRLESC